jgi:hypothetical protein
VTSCQSIGASREREFMVLVTKGSATERVSTFARDRAQAIRNVRRQMRDDGHTGPLNFKVSEVRS